MEGLNGENPYIQFAYMNFTNRDNRYFTDEMNIYAMPELRVWNHGVLKDRGYRGDRNKTSIVDFVKLRMLPPAVEVDCETMKQKANEVSFGMGYFGELDSDLFESFMYIANHKKVEDSY